MLARDRASVSTRPDTTDNKSSLLTFSATHELDEALSSSRHA